MGRNENPLRSVRREVGTCQPELSDGSLGKSRRLSCGMTWQVLSTKTLPHRAEPLPKGLGNEAGSVAAAASASKRAPNKARDAWQSSGFEALKPRVVTETIK